MMQTTNSPPQAGVLMNFIVSLLAPILLSVTDGNIDLATASVRETINDYRARNAAELITVAQIIACGLASVCSLSRSMAEDMPVPMLLRLRANGLALNRMAEQKRSLLAAPLPDDSTPNPPVPDRPIAEFEDQLKSELFLSPAAEQILAAESMARLQSPDETPVRAPSPTPLGDDTTSEKRHRQKWGIALSFEADELLASIPTLPPAEQPTATLRAAMLTRTANELLGVPMTAPPIRRDQSLFP